MDAGRQLIRFSLPGGLFAVVATLFQLAFHWAWRDRLSVSFEVLTRSALLTATGIVLLGFVIYQLYYVLYRPVIRIGRWRVYTHDRGGAILEGLRNVNDAFKTIQDSQGVLGDIGYLAPGQPDDTTYHDQWYRNAHVVRSLVNSIATSGGHSEIKREYVVLTDIYHALGACRIAVAMASIATVLDLVATGLPRWTAHDVRSLVAFVFCVVVGCTIYRVCHRNRKDTYHTMTKQLSTDLRLWWFSKLPKPLPACP